MQNSLKKKIILINYFNFKIPLSWKLFKNSTMELFFYKIL